MIMCLFWTRVKALQFAGKEQFKLPDSLVDQSQHPRPLCSDQIALLEGLMSGKSLFWCLLFFILAIWILPTVSLK